MKTRSSLNTWCAVSARKKHEQFWQCSENRNFGLVFCFCEICKTGEVIESSIFTAVHLFFRIVSSSLISDIIKEMSMGIFFQSKHTSSRIK